MIVIHDLGDAGVEYAEALDASGEVIIHEDFPIGAPPFEPSSGSEVELPLDWLRRLEIGQREGGLYFGYMERCMADAGFVWETPAWPVAPPEWAEITRYPRRYGVVTLGQAELAAYRMPEEFFPGYATEEADKDGLPTDPAEREAFQVAWGGEEYEFSQDDLLIIIDPVSGQEFIALEQPAPLRRGCKGQANTWLYGGPTNIDDAVVTINPGVARVWISTRIRVAFDEALVDQRVLTAAADWRVCMEERGWDLSGTWLPGGIQMGSQNPGMTEAESLSELERLEQLRGNTELPGGSVVTSKQNSGGLRAAMFSNKGSEANSTWPVPRDWRPMRRQMGTCTALA